MGRMLGERLRELRQARGLSIRALARETGLSPTLISQIERGVSDPSLRTLRSLADRFGTSVATLFDDGDPSEVHLSLPGARSQITAPAGFISYERLSRGHGKLEVLRGVLESGEVSSAERRAHDAVECAVVLTGTLTVEVASTTYEVPAGAALSFDSNLPHRYLNAGTERVEFIVSGTPPTS